mmetsp:Transcript_52119/g.153788  ORF Transcript_52119/g.153788 Transcript_52119/m.153788 type:complete len:176 (-) Transcript_52119:64-591(-)
MPDRQRPNILVTGTPGVGKTTLCEAIAEATKLRHLEVSKIVREEKLYKEWDDEMDCSIFDDDMVGDWLDNALEDGGCIVDFHSSACMDNEWFDLAVVLRADTETLYGRLEKRHYPTEKIQGNVEAEIFQTCLDEARELFEESPEVELLELQHNSIEEMEQAVEKAVQFVQNFHPR